MSVHKEFVQNAYPLLRTGFKRSLEKAISLIKKQNPNISLLGRSGSYAYINMDEVMGQSLDFRKAFNGGTPRPA